MTYVGNNTKIGQGEAIGEQNGHRDNSVTKEQALNPLTLDL